MNEIDYELKRENLYEIIAEKLEKVILSDSSQLEQKLPSENALAVSFGVSRPVIREAMMLLKARGLIEQKNGEGAFIKMPPPENLTKAINRMIQMQNIDIESVYSIRITLEQMAVRLLAGRVTESEILKLKEMCAEVEQNIDDIPKRAEADVRFHTALAEMSGNPLLAIFVNSLNNILISIIIESLKVISLKTDTTVILHRNIVEALENSDSDKAQQIMYEHLVQSMKNFKDSQEI